MTTDSAALEPAARPLSSANVSLPSLRTETLSSCPLCGSRDSRFWCRSWDKLLEISRDTFNYRQCNSCRTVYAADRPVQAEIHRFYPPDYAPHAPAVADAGDAHRPAGLLGAAKRLRAKLLGPASRWVIDRLGINKGADQVEGLYAGNGGTFFDFGAGNTKFVSLMRQRGWEAAAADFAPDVVRDLEAGGYPAYLIEAASSWAKIPDASFSFIRMYHVLEHLYDPKAVLKQLRAKAKPGATLHVGIPNPAGFTARLFKGSWHALDCPRHVMLFDPAQVQRLFSDCGFDRVRVFQRASVLDLARSLAYAAADAGWLRKQRAQRLFTAPEVQMLLAVPAWLFAALGKGDRLDLIVEVAPER